MRSLFAAISGLKGHQLMMDTVGNNISNVNTTAFKAARVTFQDIISQTIRAGSGSGTTLGGLNPIQVGLGMQTGTIDTLMSQGHLQATNKPTDLALQGDGFLVLSDNAAVPTYTFTRDGNLALGLAAAANGPRPLLHSSTGLHVKGYTPPLAAGTADSTTPPATDLSIPQVQGAIAVTGFSVDTSGIISLTLADGTTVPNYAQVAVANFQNAAGLTRVGSNQFAANPNTGTATYNGAAVNGRGQINSGFLEMSNVDLAGQFTSMIIAERGFQANSRVITASDEILQDLVNIKR